MSEAEKQILLNQMVIMAGLSGIISKVTDEETKLPTMILMAERMQQTKKLVEEVIQK